MLLDFNYRQTKFYIHPALLSAKQESFAKKFTAEPVFLFNPDTHNHSSGEFLLRRSPQLFAHPADSD